MWRTAGGPTKADHRSSTSFAPPLPRRRLICGGCLRSGLARCLVRTIGALPDHVMVLAVGTHISRGSHPVGHVIESGDGSDIPDLPTGESAFPQALSIGLLDLVGLLGELYREVEHRFLARRQVGRPV